ncbi:MAG: LPP20 family lipoprotein, partial [Bacteroidales bacterium]|nr:LPP20 family lipoprotein [Bacteroidales bacterium]
MVRKSSLIVLFCLCVIVVFSQKITWDGIKANRTVYICGEGYGETIDEADKRALSDLANQISVDVRSQATMTTEELITNTDIKSSQDFSSTINTYSRATFNNAEKFIISDEPDAHVGRYIKRTDLQRIFDDRKNKILDFVKLAEKAEEQANVDVALKNYYWAYMLLQTMQYPDAVKYKSENGEE